MRRESQLLFPTKVNFYFLLFPLTQPSVKGKLCGVKGMCWNIAMIAESLRIGCVKGRSQCEVEVVRCQGNI